MIQRVSVPAKNSTFAAILQKTQASGSKQRLINATYSTKQGSRLPQTIIRTFRFEHVILKNICPKDFYHFLLARLLVEDFLSLHEERDYSTATHKKSFKYLLFETEWNSYNDFTLFSLVSKLKLSEGRKKETYETIEVRKVKRTIKRRSSR